MKWNTISYFDKWIYIWPINFQKTNGLQNDSSIISTEYYSFLKYIWITCNNFSTFYLYINDSMSIDLKYIIIIS